MTEEDGAFWIKTDPSVDGSTYVVSIEFSDDRAITLTPDHALRYASRILAAAQRAEYDAAVFSQIGKLVNGDAEVAQLINDLRKDRPPLDDEATAPLRVDPGVNRAGKPFLALFIDETQVGQWELTDAREHALGVLETVEAAHLDAGYFRALTGIVGVEEHVARNVIDDLGKHRP